jgi:hypothetical protein
VEKGKLKQRFAFLADHDLLLEEGKDKERLKKLKVKSKIAYISHLLNLPPFTI